MEPLVETAKVSEKGQIVIPRDLRNLLGLKTGSRLILIATDEAIVMQKVELLEQKLRLRDILERARTLAEKLMVRK